MAEHSTHDPLLRGRVRVDLMIHADRSYCDSDPFTRLGNRVCVDAQWFDEHTTLRQVFEAMAPAMADEPVTRFPYLTMTRF